MTIKDIFELRKQGKIEEAYNAVLPMYKVHHGHYTTICMFWCAADMAQLLIERKNDKEAVRILRSLSRLYPAIDDSNGTARQALLNIALQLAEEDDFSFIGFVKWWDVNYLTDDDWQTAESNGHTLPSRGQKIATRMFHEAQETNDKQKQQQTLAFIEMALQHHSRNRHLQRARAWLLAATGDKEQALQVYRRMTRYGKDAYIFSELAELTDDTNEKIRMTIRAISLQRTEAFRQKDRLRLAVLLQDLHPQNARYELDKVIAQRKNANMRNTRQINQLLRHLQNTVPVTTIEQQEFYKTYPI